MKKQFANSIRTFVGQAAKQTRGRLYFEGRNNRRVACGETRS